jgi:protein-S-isoprenylcysteine O-methyltransferase Ste14
MTLAWIVNIIVIIGVAYLSFAMALAGWLAGLKRGEAVTLVKMKGDRKQGMWAQIALVGFSLVITVFLFYWLWIPLPVSPPRESMPVFMVIGLGIFILGVLFTLWARQTLGRMWGISTSREVKLLPDHQLIDQGPYAIIRHPMYLGWWMAMLGLILIYWTWILVIFFILSLLVFYKRARREELVLAERFGEQWQAYVKRTKFLVPWIY